jgi:TRAP transporter TAXI family solute receptor
MTLSALSNPASRRLVTSLRGPLAVLLLACGCSSGPGRSDSPEEAPWRRPVVLLTGPVSGAYSPLGQALAAIYNIKVPGVRVTAESTDGPEGAALNAIAVETGKADLAFSRADLAFQSFSRRLDVGSESSVSHVRSIAVIYTNVVHLLVRRASGIRRGEDMRGHRVQMADEGSGGALARVIIEGHGLAPGDVQIVSPSGNALARLKSGGLDVRVFASAYPLAGIDDVGETSAVALLSLAPSVVHRLRSKFPFFKPAVIPKGTYRGQSRDVPTVGIDGLLLCRDTMPESLAYDLTKALFEALPELSRTQNAARLINAVNAPATPVPLHPGAARFYRERDLFR